MNTPEKAVVLAGGDLTPNPAMRALLRGAAFIVAADSGVRHAAPLGCTPDLIVGDFDSATAPDLARYPHVPREHHPAHKNQLDLELALDHALRRGATRIVILGGLGARLDQSLAALLIAARLCRQGVAVTLHTGEVDVYYLVGASHLELPLAEGQTFSLLSLEAVSTVSLHNACYALEQHPLEFGVGLGVSNHVARTPLVITSTDGLVVVITGRLE